MADVSSLINPKTGKPFGQEEEKTRMIGKYPLTLETRQSFLLPYTGDVVDGPIPLQVSMAHCGERNVVIRNGLSPVLFVDIPVIRKQDAAVIEAVIYCIKSGTEYPAGMRHLGTLTIGENDYHFMA